MERMNSIATNDIVRTYVSLCVRTCVDRKMIAQPPHFELSYCESCDRNCVNMATNNQAFPPCRPPSSSLHPLLLLDEFLESLEKEKQAETDAAKTAANTINVTPSPQQSLEKRRDYILRVADFLYGSNMLEAALAVLDTEGAIRQVTAQTSQRSAFLVRGSALLLDRIMLVQTTFV